MKHISNHIFFLSVLLFFFPSLRVKASEFSNCENIDTSAIEPQTPLCELIRQPTASQFYLRITSQVFNDIYIEDYYSDGKHLYVVKGDDGNPLTQPEVQKLRNQAIPFQKAINSAGLNRMWTASDPICKSDYKIMGEARSIIEYYDANGYKIRTNPRVQECSTEYRELFTEVTNMIHRTSRNP